MRRLYSRYLKIQVQGKKQFYSLYLGYGSREHSLPAPIYKYIPIGRECAGTHPYSVGRMSTPPHTGGSPPSTTAKCKEKRKSSNLKR